MNPFVKWPGGKRQMLDIIVKKMPEKFNTYYEPFVGGGSVTLYLGHEKTVINDLNTALINTYKQIKQDPYGLMDAIDRHDTAIGDGGGTEYYKIRDLYNKKVADGEYDIQTAAMFIVLNKHCFNGLYRVNSRGMFNTPYNGKHVLSYDKENMLGVYEFLKDVLIYNTDFSDIISLANAGDFIFIDSPYVPEKTDSFVSYTKTGFTLDDHKRLSVAFDDATSRGVLCMMTNSNTDGVYELYGGKGYNIDVFNTKRSINSNGAGRNGQDVIITNYVA